MIKVIFESWREGLEKVTLTKLQVEKLGLSLKESKNNVDSLLNDEIVLFEINDVDVAKDFLRQANGIGVNCRIETED